jgi:alkanesulfonate monooxygenase SsuD/methylene tetrahydromethanopterin reductase-like flavin-dependent oxidoreductase (luciferase family)
VLHAKIIATIDHLAGGRFILGAGAGWAREEFEVLGTSFDDRGPRFDESIGILRALWTGDYVDFKGDFFTIDGWTCRPAPARQIPIWVGGDTMVARKRAGRLGDAWLTHGYRIPTVREDFEVVREAAAASGRDPDLLSLAMTGITTLGRDRLERAAEALHRAKEAGVQHASVGVERSEVEQAPELYEQFAARYLKELQGEPERSLP